MKKHALRTEHGVVGTFGGQMKLEYPMSCSLATRFLPCSEEVYAELSTSIPLHLSGGFCHPIGAWTGAYKRKKVTGRHRR